MKPRTKILFVSAALLVFFIGLIQIGAVNDPLVESGSGDFIDTESKNIPEIIVDEQTFEKMPKAEKILTQLEAETLHAENTQEKLPEKINLKVPFYPQAPDGNWSLPWKEACEESSVALAYHFVQDKELTKEQFKKEVLEMVELEKEILGKYIDTSMEETAQFLEEYYDYTDYKIIDNPTVEDIKYELSQGHPIVAPFAGKKLGNSYFTNGGPRYHVLVITGYDEKVFFTNDVGTSRGENFTYEQEVIMDSMHDLIPNGQGDIVDGEKRILVLQ